MKKIKLDKAVAFLAALMIISSGFAISYVAFGDENDEQIVELAPLDVPINLVLNRGHIPELSFGGPMGLSWDDVSGRTTFTVFAFRNESENNPSEAYAFVDNIDALYLNVNTGFAADLSNGPFWFRVQAVGGSNSALSEPIGPFWNTFHSDEFAANPAGSFALFNNPAIPVIVLDTRRPVERATQGNIVGDIHVPWPNALAVEEGITHADFQNAVFAAWQNFIDNDLTEAQRANLNPELEYRDIHFFIF